MMEKTWPLWVTLAVGLGLWAITHLDVRWATWAPATCMPHDCFCEALRAGFVRQPSNTWSNLAFVWVGLLIVRGDGPRGDGPGATVAVPLRDDPLVRGLFGATAVFIGLGSWWYHASLTFVGMWFDVMAMYLLPTFLGLYNLHRARWVPRAAFLPLWAVINAALGVGLVVLPAWRRPVFAALVALLLLTEVWVRRVVSSRMRRAHLFAALGLLAGAFGIWILDLKRILCVPDSLVQGHALWHLLCAAAAWQVHRYYVSESPAETRVPPQAGHLPAS